MNMTTRMRVLTAVGAILIGTAGTVSLSAQTTNPPGRVGASGSYTTNAPGRATVPGTQTTTNPPESGATGLPPVFYAYPLLNSNGVILWPPNFWAANAASLAAYLGGNNEFGVAFYAGVSSNVFYHTAMLDTNRLTLTGFTAGFHDATNGALDLSILNGGYQWSGKAYTNGGGIGIVYIALDNVVYATNAVHPTTGTDYLVDNAGELLFAVGPGIWEDSQGGVTAGISYWGTNLVSTNAFVLRSGQADLMQATAASALYATTAAGLAAPVAASNVLATNTVVGSNMVQRFTLSDYALDQQTWFKGMVGAMNGGTNVNRFGYRGILSKIQSRQPFTLMFYANGWIPDGLLNYVYYYLTNFVPVRGFGGSSLLGGMVAQAWVSGAAQVNGTSLSSDGYWYGPWQQLPNNSSAQVDFLNTSSYSSGMLFDTFRLIYVTAPDGGSFKVQTNINSGAWTDLAGYTSVSSVSSTTNTAIISWTNAAPANVGVRVISLGSDGTHTNRIANVDCSNSTITNGFKMVPVWHQGVDYAYYNSFPTNHQGPVLQLWNPDLIVMPPWGLVSGEDSAQWRTLYTNVFSVYATNAGIVVCGMWPRSATDEAAGEAVTRGQMQLATYQYGQSYFDAYVPFGSYGEMQARGLVDPDGGHLTAAGYAAYGTLLWDWLGLIGAPPAVSMTVSADTATFGTLNLTGSGLVSTAGPSLTTNGAGQVVASYNGGALTNLNAMDLASGTMPDARLSANVAMLNSGANPFTVAPKFGAGFSVGSPDNVGTMNGSGYLVLGSDSLLDPTNAFEVHMPGNDDPFLAISTNGALNAKGPVVAPNFIGVGAAITGLEGTNVVSHLASGANAPAGYVQTADGAGKSSFQPTTGGGAAQVGATTNQTWVVATTMVGDGVTDNTAAFQKLVDDNIGNDNTNHAVNVTIYVPPGIYAFTAPPTNWETNELGVIGIPHKASVTSQTVQWSALHIVGYDASGYASGTGSAGDYPTNGTVFLLLENTNATWLKSKGWETNTLDQFNFTTLFLKNINIVVTNNSPLTALDLRAFASAVLDGVSVVHSKSGTSLAQPTGGYGVMMPAIDGDNSPYLSDVNIEGFWGGLQTCEHLSQGAGRVNICNCLNGLVLGPGNFPAHFRDIYIGNCATSIVSFAANKIKIDSLEIERSATDWRTNYLNFADANTTQGTINYVLKDNGNAANNDLLRVAASTGKGVSFKPITYPGRTVITGNRLATDTFGKRGEYLIGSVASAVSPSYGLFKTRGTEATAAAVTSGDALGVLSFAGYDGATYPGLVSAYISASVDGSVSSGNVPTRLQLWAGHNNSAPLGLTLRETYVAASLPFYSTNDMNVLGVITQGTNAIANWPAAAVTPGGCAWVNSNATIYILTSTPNSTAWAATNKIAGP